MLPVLFFIGVSHGPATISAATADNRFGAMTHFAHGWDPVWADIAALRGIKTGMGQRSSVPVDHLRRSAPVG